MGTALEPKPYLVISGVPITSDGKTPATEEQVEAKDIKIQEYDRREYLAQHVVLSTTSTRLGAKIKNMTTAKEMWEAVKADATTKSSLYILDAEDQLSSMKLAENEDPKTHPTEMKHHFQSMIQRRDNLMKMGSELSATRFNTIIMSSLPESYRPTLQTITAAEKANAITGGSSNKMKADDLIAFLIEEAEHRVINAERSKNSEQALAAHTKRKGRAKGKQRAKDDDNALSADSDITCHNCKKKGHKQADCWSKGGGKEGQGPRQKKGKKTETAVVATVNDDDNEMFAFTCTSDFANIAEALQVPKSGLGTCIDSGASRVYSPDRTKFTNYRSIDRRITAADGRELKAIGMGDLEMELPNGSGITKMRFVNAIHSPDMAFTLISISRLDKAGYKVTFQKGMCRIMNPQGQVIATIPHSDGLYRVSTSNPKPSKSYAAAASEKMMISEAHRKLGHVSHRAIGHAVSKGYITGIDLDSKSKPEFCDVCAKAKAARVPFPKESKTRATKYGERVHWDLWGPATVKSINGNHYMAARIDDATRETKLYFQEKKSQTFDSYKKDEAYIETQTGNHIKVVRSDRGREFQSKQFSNHQDQKGTIREFTVHDSPPQNGVAEHGMRTRAERARALLISSGLPRFLWEEAMKHSTWLQNRLPAAALESKTPYEMKNKKKPHLAGIQEFGSAAYVKDLKAGKLEARAQVGRFVGYDSESKGYRIYWPGKRSITVERNVVFNESDVRSGDESITISSGILSEGEMESSKIIQSTTKNVKESEQSTENDEESEKGPSEETEDSDEPNQIPFPTIPNPATEEQEENCEGEDLEHYG